ncbi:hypothetical protein ABZP36_002886 [Zizania latifolia]
MRRRRSAASSTGGAEGAAVSLFNLLFLRSNAVTFSALILAARPHASTPRSRSPSLLRLNAVTGLRVCGW